MAIKTKNQRRSRVSGKQAKAAQSISARLSKPSVRALREELGLTRDVFSRLLGFSIRTIAEWEGGKAPGASKTPRVAEVQRLKEGLARVMKSRFIGGWLQTPNEAFGGLKPIEVIERGEVDRIWRMIYQLESGEPS